MTPGSDFAWKRLTGFERGYARAYYFDVPPDSTENPPPFDLELRVRSQDEGLRLDRFLAERVPAIGRSSAHRLCRESKVLVDGSARKKSVLVHEGQTVRITLGQNGRALPAPDLDVSIVLQTDQLVIADKPAKIPCGALVGREEGTLAGALLARYPEMAHVGYSDREPGLVNRIDNETSGLVLAARRQDSFFALKRALSAQKIEKEYLAWVAPGILPDQGIVEGFLAPDPNHRRRVRVSDQGHPSRTEYVVEARGTSSDRVLVRVHAAYRHQIRCHLAHLGAPLLGDALYGVPHPELGSRHALHASYMSGAAAGVPRFTARSAPPLDLTGLV